MIDLQIGNKIKFLSKKSNLTIKELCNRIEMTESGFNIALKNNTLKIETLQKISEVLEVDISYFFGNEITKNENSNELLDKIKELENKISHLEFLYLNFKEYREILKNYLEISITDISALLNGDKFQTSELWNNLLKNLDLKIENSKLIDNIDKRIIFSESFIQTYENLKDKNIKTIKPPS